MHRIKGFAREYRANDEQYLYTTLFPLKKVDKLKNTENHKFSNTTINPF